METEEERRERLENVVATKWLSLAMETDEKRCMQKKKSKTSEDGSYHTAQIGLETEEERRATNGLDLIWI